MLPNPWLMLVRMYVFRIMNTDMEEMFLVITCYTSMFSKMFLFGWRVFVFCLVLFSFILNWEGKYIDVVPNLHKGKISRDNKKCLSNRSLSDASESATHIFFCFDKNSQSISEKVYSYTQGCWNLFKKWKQTDSFFLYLIILRLIYKFPKTYKSTKNLLVQVFFYSEKDPESRLFYIDNYYFTGQTCSTKYCYINIFLEQNYF